MLYYGIPFVDFIIYGCSYCIHQGVSHLRQAIFGSNIQMLLPIAHIFIYDRVIVWQEHSNCDLLLLECANKRSQNIQRTIVDKERTYIYGILKNNNI